MIGALSLRRRLTGSRRDEANRNSGLSGASDQEGFERERVGKARRKKRRRECHHDPWARELAKTIMGCYYWLLEPFTIKSELGNGLEGTSWTQFCQSEKTIILGMMAFRTINLLAVQTFYVPDEYWQSLEIAHNHTFGLGHITWEWTARIRGYLYPSVFTILYKALDLIGMCSYPLLTRVPRLLQALMYAVGDLYLYKFSLNISNHLVAQWTLLCNCLSWFIFYCATRTLANTAETSLFIMALYHFPLDSVTPSANDRTSKASWKFLWIVAMSVMIRPTSLIMWLPLCTCHVWYMRRQLWKVFVLYAGTAGVFLFIMMRIDKAMYGEWTLVPLNFFYFNISKKVSHIYGTHPWHWYVTHCLPFVLSTHLILLVLGWKRCKNRTLQVVFVWTLMVYSWQPHKEFRFLLPILPLAMHICGYYITTLHQQLALRENQKRHQLEAITEEQVSKFIKQYKDKRVADDDDGSGVTSSELSDTVSETEIMESVKRKLNRVTKSSSTQWMTPRRAVLLLVIGNLPLMMYFGLIHQRGALDVVHYLHEESLTNGNMSVLFLMPCHSTPYYSHVHANITMRFLTCEPNLSGADNYTDEADAFYQNPISWLKTEVVKRTSARHVYSHVVMFDVLEPTVDTYLSKGKYQQVATFFYTHLSNDSRRSRLIKVFRRPMSNKI